MRRTSDAVLLELVGELHGLLELPDLREGLLVALDRAVPADWVSINELGPAPGDVHAVARPWLGEEQLAVFARHAGDNPLLARFARTQDGRPHRFSDVISRADLRATGLYREFYAAIGLEFQIAFVISTVAGSYVAIALSRRARDFTDAERDLLDRARPHLVQLYRNAIAHTALVGLRRAHRTGDALTGALMARGLTPRAAAVLSRVAHGQSNADVATALGISERTVGKHLQACYRELGVTDRSEAAAAAWRL